ncbi:Oxysterol-binding protein- protein 8 [Actinomortierella ambigua]|uniref:Peptidyl-tRNA hydrolase n=1 Tax=Actinomortierella ambigua TaxID=1343610 RepID=A0A9P6QM17_9FUNG|nr:Oxysterol-binding protein- protein 8 [Actinomortierella ambigua]
MASNNVRHIILVGLGNKTHPGTRHNVGMMALDYIAAKHGCTWTRKPSWDADVAETTIRIKQKRPKPPKAKVKPVKEVTEGDDAAPATPTITTSTTPCVGSAIPNPAPPQYLELHLIMIKSWMAMNICGPTFAKALRDSNLTAQDVVVMHDDMERDIGKLSMKQSGSANGHNGVLSITKHFKTDHFRRLRMGIGRPSGGTRRPNDVARYVLGKFKPNELAVLEDVVYEQTLQQIIQVFSAATAKAAHSTQKQK